MSTSDKGEWISRVLGISLADFRPRRDQDGTTSTVTQGTKAAGGGELAFWRKAKQTVDGAIDELAEALRATEDPLVQRLAMALPDLGKDQAIALETALRGLEKSSPDRRQDAAEAVRGAARAYRTALATQTAFRLIDDNPFGIKVAMRESLDRAMVQLEQSIAESGVPGSGRTLVPPVARA